LGSYIVDLRNNLLKTSSWFLKNESGATAMEFGLIGVGISVAIMAVVNGFGAQLDNKFTHLDPAQIVKLGGRGKPSVSQQNGKILVLTEPKPCPA
jgi:pilus assembly protein Flp/PilA